MTVSTQFRDDLRGEEKARIAEIIWGASIPTPSILLALFFSLSLSLCDFASSFRSTLHVLLRLPSRDRNPRYARFASTPRPIICCFRSTIFDRSISGIERLKVRSDKSAETVFFNSLISPFCHHSWKLKEISRIFL